jgi:hypothetical protein
MRSWLIGQMWLQRVGKHVLSDLMLKTDRFASLMNDRDAQAHAGCGDFQKGQKNQKNKGGIGALAKDGARP